MPNPFLMMGALQGAYGWYHDKKERGKIDSAVKEIKADVERERRFTATANRGAYSNALAFMSANKSNPNAWNFAASTYGNEVSGNMSRLNQRESEATQQITGLELSKPDDSAGKLWGDIAMGGMNSYLFSKFAGLDTGDTGDWSLKNLWNKRPWFKGDWYVQPRGE